MTGGGGSFDSNVCFGYFEYADCEDGIESDVVFVSVGKIFDKFEIAGDY